MHQYIKKILLNIPVLYRSATSRAVIFYVVSSALITLVALSIYTYTRPSPAYAAPATTLNFQARLLNGTGSVVDDGTYDIVFNLYEDSTGGSTLWTETWNSGSTQVTIKGGYLSVYLGTHTSFPTLDWSDDKFLTMNVEADGEMTPRLKLTAVPFAFNSQQLEGRGADEFVQLDPGASAQNVNTANSAINILQAGNGTVLNLASSGTGNLAVLDTSNASANGASIDVQSNASTEYALSVTSNNGAIQGLYVRADGNVGIGTSSPGEKLRIKSAGTGTNTVRIDASGAGKLFVFNENAGGNAVLRLYDSTDAQKVQIHANGDTHFSSGGSFGIGTTTPDRKLDVLDASNPQLRLTHTDGTIYTDLQTTSSGYLNITPSGNRISLGVASATPVELVLGIKNTTGDPTGTEGSIYYNTTDNKFRCYEDTGWKDCDTTGADPFTVVAATNSTATEKNAADYIADGTSDQTEINNALTAVAGNPAAGGTVLLLPGTYTIDGSISIPNNTTLAGSGASTVITIPNTSAAFNLITNTDVTTGRRIAIRDLRIDGNEENQGNNQKGIYLQGMGGGTGTSSRVGSLITNVWVENTSSNGIQYEDSDRNTLTDSFVAFTEGSAVRFDGGSTRNLASDNLVQGNGSSGIYLGSATEISVINNKVQDNTSRGIWIDDADNNLISGNSIHNNGGTGSASGIELSGTANDNTITDNYITDTAGTSYAIAILASTANDNYLSGNRYSGTGASTILDNGTNTIYAGQLDASGNYEIQPAGNINLIANTNITGELTVDGNFTFAEGANRTLSVAANATANGAGYSLSVVAGAADGTGTGNVGGILSLTGGAAAGSGNNNGGGVTIAGGAGTGTGARGVVNIQTSSGDIELGSGGAQFNINSNTEFFGSNIMTNDSSSAFAVQTTLGIRALTVDTATRQVGLGVSSVTAGYTAEVGGDLKVNGNFVEEKTTFTPAVSAGSSQWYRIINTNGYGGTSSGTIRLYAGWSTDNTVTEVQFDYYVGGYGQVPFITVTQNSKYSGAARVVEAIRASNNGGNDAFIDILVKATSNPEPIEVFGYGPNLGGMQATPAQNPTNGTDVASRRLVSLAGNAFGIESGLATTDSTFISVARDYGGLTINKENNDLSGTFATRSAAASLLFSQENTALWTVGTGATSTTSKDLCFFDEYDSGTGTGCRLLLQQDGTVQIDGNTIFVDAIGNKVNIGTSTSMGKFTVDTDPGENVTALVVQQEDDVEVALHITNAGTGNSIQVRTSDFVVSGSGNVGIGTSSPSSYLTANLGVVVGTGNASTAAEVSLLGDHTADGVLGQFNFRNDVDSGNRQVILEGARAGADNSGEFRIYTNNAGTLGQRLTVQAGGNVGIGTNVPTTNLHVLQGASGRAWGSDSNDIFAIENNTTAAIDIITPNNVGGYILFSDQDARAQGQIRYEHSNNVLSLITAGSTRFSLDANGGAFNATNSSPFYTGLSVRANDYATNGGYMLFGSAPGTNSYGIIQAGDNGNYEEISINPNGGNVGIGTISPNAVLEVSSFGTATSGTRARISQSAGTAYDALLDFYSGGATAKRGFVGWKNSTDAPTPVGMYLWNSDNTPIMLGTTNAERLRITAAGDVGIGLSAPTNKLAVSASATNYNQTNALIGARGNGNNFEFGHVNGAGYGSTLGSNVGNGVPFLCFSCEAGTNNNTYRTRGLLGSTIQSDLAGGFLFGTVGNANADNQSLSTLLQVTSSGLVDLATDTGIQIGTSNNKSIYANSSTPYDFLNIESKGRVGTWSGAINFNVSYNTSSAYTALQIRDEATVPNMYAPSLNGASSSNYLYWNGTTGEIYPLVSSARYKKDITTLSDDWSKILQARPVRYKEKQNNEEHIGFIAEEFDALGLTDLVGYDSLGRPDSVHYDKVSMYNLGVLKDHNARIQTLEQNLGAMKNQNYLQNNDNATFTNLNVNSNTTLKNLTVLTDVTIANKLTVKTVEVTGNLTVGGKIISKGATPHVKDFAVLGLTTEGANVTIEGTDTAGTITLTTGDNPTLIIEGEEQVLTEVEFNKPFTGATPRIVITAKDGKSARLPVYIRATQTGYKLFLDTPLTANTTYQFDYIIIGSQTIATP